MRQPGDSFTPRFQIWNKKQAAPGKNHPMDELVGSRRVVWFWAVQHELLFIGHRAIVLGKLNVRAYETISNLG